MLRSTNLIDQELPTRRINRGFATVSLLLRSKRATALQSVLNLPYREIQLKGDLVDSKTSVLIKGLNTYSVVSGCISLLNLLWR